MIIYPEKDDLWFLDVPRYKAQRPPQDPLEVRRDEELLAKYDLIESLPLEYMTSDKDKSSIDYNNQRMLHVICVDCSNDIIVPSFDEEEGKYKECVNCGRNLFVIHEASMCLVAKKFCPIWRERNNSPRMTSQFWINQIKELSGMNSF